MQFFYTIAGRYSIAKSCAKRRHIEFSITREEFRSIVEGAVCYYCGRNLNPTGSGVDRVDNSKGYTASNIVACCKICNDLKSDKLTGKEMVETVKLLKSLGNRFYL